LTGENSSLHMLERLRQAVGREIRHRAGGVAASEVDKTGDRYVRKLQQVRGNTAAVRGWMCYRGDRGAGTNSALASPHISRVCGPLLRIAWFTKVWRQIHIAASYQTFTMCRIRIRAKGSQQAKGKVATRPEENCWARTVFGY
jgi:hypothetical protein